MVAHARTNTELNTIGNIGVLQEKSYTVKATTSVTSISLFEKLQAAVAKWWLSPLLIIVGGPQSES